MRGQQNPHRRFRHSQLGYIGIGGRRALGGASGGRREYLALLNAAALNLDMCAETLDPRITASRASTRTYFDATGTLQTAAVDAFPREYDPVTLACLGRSFWEARTNSIRNNTMVGAVAGTPGTDPTGWASSTFAGLTREIIGIGTENGITYLEVRLSGTATGNSDFQFGQSNHTAALQNQVWTHTAYVKLQAGSLTNISSINFIISEYSVVPAFLTAGTTNITPTSSALNTNRSMFTRTLTNASTAFVVSLLRINSTGAIDITLRIGMPQLELGATTTPVIPTTNAAVTRSADVVSMTGTNFSSWYNQTEGTFLARAVVTGTTEDSTSRVIFAAGDSATFNESLYVVRNASSASITANILDGGVAQWASNLIGTCSSNTFFSVAAAYKANDCAGSMNGGSINSDTSVSLPTANSLGIGKASWVNNNYLNGWISRIAYWNRRLPNADLRTLSSGGSS